MRKIILVIILVLLGTNILMLSLLLNGNRDSSNYIPSKEIDVRQPVAVINEEEIYYNEWMNYLGTHFGEEALTQMVDRHVVSQLADQYNLSVDPGVIELEVSLLASLAGQMRQEDVVETEEEWRETIEHRLLTEKIFTRDVTISEADIESYYNTYQSQYEFSHRVEVSHIVVADQETANRIYNELEEGANFAALAREYSIDEESLLNGGYLGFFTEGSSFLPDGYFEEVRGLDQFSYSEPVRVNQGFAILYLHRELPRVELSYDQLKDHIRTKLAVEEVGEPPSTQAFWQQLDVDWIYHR
ncbi:peptidylprolyl isomerase [Amphibacillus jilinensis]|uniref:peptidylprolyl isomerase n=1 Tax=Amphibacillus jilinensis TaxID=1216008 RepID=UPI0002D608EC|nr:peptidylprolyl isomerase [Amphibacillus jilinensis]